MDTFEPKIVFEKPEEPIVIQVKSEVLDVAFQNLAVYYSELNRNVTRVEVSLRTQADGISIILKDDGEPIDLEEFENLTRPLTKIDKYLDVSVAKMPMLLRTVARASEIMGGGFICGETEGCCVFLLHIRDEASNEVADAKKNATLTTDLLPDSAVYKTPVAMAERQ